MKIGLQLYTVRRAANNDLLSTLKATAKLGYLTCEYAYVPFNKENAQIINRASQEANITLSAIQTRLVIMEEKFEEIVQFLAATSCSVANISIMPLEYQRGSKGALFQMLTRIENLALRYANHNIKLNYRHHDFEFVGKRGMRQIDYIVEGLEHAGLILDTYWATKGGEYVPHFIEKAKDKVYGLHLKDYVLKRGVIFPKAKDCALGDGVIDFAEILKLAEEIGVKYAAVSQNTPFPFTEAAKSAKYIRDIGFGHLLKA